MTQLSENLQFKGNSFNVLVLSFDPRDTTKDMELMAARLGLKNKKQWMFGTTNRIEELNQSIGFTPVWDSLRNQYDHDALLVGINSEGYITKKLLGIRQGNTPGLGLLFIALPSVLAILLLVSISYLVGKKRHIT